MGIVDLSDETNAAIKKVREDPESRVSDLFEAAGLEYIPDPRFVWLLKDGSTSTNPLLSEIKES